MQFKAIVNGKQVGNPSPQRVGVWNVLLEHGGTGRFSWKFAYDEGRHLYQGTVTMLAPIRFGSPTEKRIWVTVPYEIIRIE
jgi:hypothetical protein